jgi:creatinine amidohydrolase
MSDARGIELLASRMEAVVGELGAHLASPIDAATAVGNIIATGTGGSEGPARVLVAALAARTEASARHARFLPLSSFASPSGLAALDRSASLWLFSQGISPNATIALRARERVASMTVVTATLADPTADRRSAAGTLAEAERRGARLIHHGPREERGLLVRVIGPVLATLTALRATGLRPPSDLPDRYRTAMGLARERFAAVQQRFPRGPAASSAQALALVTSGDHFSLAHGLRWKLFEAAGIPDPPVWDVLQFAHGPFQQAYERSMLLCALERPGEAALFDRLERMLVADRHALLRLPATLPWPWCWFEHDAMINELTLALLRARPLDLAHWPGQGADDALYGWDGSDQQ